MVAMSVENTWDSCELGVFFPKHFPHIMERIFFSMDLKTYKKSREVYITWNNLLTTRTYQAKEKQVLCEDILKLERELLPEMA